MYKVCKQQMQYVAYVIKPLLLGYKTRVTHITLQAKQQQQPRYDRNKILL